MPPHGPIADPAPRRRGCSGRRGSFHIDGGGGAELVGGLDTFEIMLYRSGDLGWRSCSRRRGHRGTLHRQMHHAARLHLMRNLFHFTGQNLWFFALR